MIGINWDAVGGDSLNLQTLFSADDIAKMDSRAKGNKGIADRIMVWNATNDEYTNYYLQKISGVVVGWSDYSTSDVDPNAKIPAGAAAWYYRHAATDIEVSEASPLAK